MGHATEIHFDGNPAKFLQGHNLFGSGDLISLVLDCYMQICRSLGVIPSSSDLAAVRAGDYPISRIDITRSFALNCRADVRSFIRAAEFKSRTRAGRSQLKGNTLYFNKTSSRWTFKFYGKGDEIEARGHQLPDQLLQTPLPQWADNKLRVELTLRKKELTDIEITAAKQLTIERCQSLYNDYLGRIDMTDQLPLSSERLLDLPSNLKATYALWNNAEDLRSLLPRSTYYKHRKALLSFGVDIAIRKECNDVSNVVPLIRILEAEPASIPDFGYQLNLVHHSATG
jgi:II/X family phage/plasmid replication protein